MSNAFNVTIDFRGADVLAGKLDALVSRALLRLSAADAVNEVAVRFDKTAKQGMNAGLNLSDAYIATRMTIGKASSAGTGPVRAEIVTRGDLTILSHFPHAQLTQSAPRAKGDPKRGIAPGRKQAGIAAEITRGSAKAVDKWFTMTLRGSGKVGVFFRPAGGKPVHKYGPSPYSLFRHQIEQGQDDLAEDLQRTAAEHAADTIRKGLT